MDEIREITSAEFTGIFAGDRPRAQVQTGGIKLESTDPDEWMDLARAATTACTELIQARNHLAHEIAVRLNEKETHGNTG